ncbi:hypothetical protein CDD83_10371 [Cordyceps sp. RAO-2017]|nr:hypothetical protein CDD83_10371 [Cordyceps sp. RAO-2017]
MLRQVKPRNARSKRALERRAPKAVENAKTCLFLRGTSCSQVVQDALNELFALRQPLAKKFSKRNAVRPFEDAASLEFFSDKNDASLLVLGSSQKKRPHGLTLVRTFGHRLLDMLELQLDPAAFRRMADFRTTKPAVGLRPLVLFAGAAFDDPAAADYALAKSLLLDLFRGEPLERVDVEGLRYLVSITADGEADARPAIRLRLYLIRTRRSGHRLPRVELEEMGPRMDLRIGRARHADEATLKEAMRRPRGLEERAKKNVSTDAVGDKIGRVHLGRQDLSQLQTRKMKGLKRSRAQAAAHDDDDEEADIVSDDGDTKRKKR